MSVHERLVAVANQAGLRSIDGAVRLTSASNEAWKVGEIVLRISWSADPDRLRREVSVLEHLPGSVPRPELLGHGTTHGRTWTSTRWVPGNIAIDTWRMMPPEHRDGFARQLAEAVAAIHSWSPPPELRELIRRRGPARTVAELLGQDVNPLPVDRALAVVDEAKRAPHADPAVIDAAAERLADLRSLDVDGGPVVVIHGDLHLGNVVELDGSLQTLLDFEWVRLGPQDLDLQAFLRASEDSHSTDVIRRLAQHHPAIVHHPRIVERLWLYDLACTLRDVIVTPASGDRPRSHLEAHHPLRRLEAIVEGPAYIQRLLG